MLSALVSGCAGPNPLVHTAGTHGVAGFWAGLWHGLICSITFIISLFNRNVHMYEVHNNGGWYDLGFLLGASMSLGGMGRGSRRRR
jgi:uncharacterized iron-regulated membrane protein